MYKFHCPHCQQKISAEPDQSGMNFQCPTCGGDFVVPPPEESEGHHVSIMDEEIHRSSNLSEQKQVEQVTPDHDSLLSKSKKQKNSNWVSRKNKSRVALALGLILGVGSVVYYFNFAREIPPDITNLKSVSHVMRRSVEKEDVDNRVVDGKITYFKKGSNKPVTGWIKGEECGIHTANLLYVEDGKLRKEWNFYASNKPNYEIIYDSNSPTEANGLSGVKTFRRWKPDGDACLETSVTDGNGKVLEYDERAWYRNGGGTSKNGEYTVKAEPTLVLFYENGRVASRRSVDTDYAEKMHRNQSPAQLAGSEEHGSTSDIGMDLSTASRLKKVLSSVYPDVSLKRSVEIADQLFGVTSDDRQATQRNRMLDEVLEAARSASISEEEVLKKCSYWIKRYRSEVISLPEDKFEYDYSRMVVDKMKSAISSSSQTNESSKRMGWDTRVLNPLEIMDRSCSEQIEFTKTYKGYIALKGAAASGRMPKEMKNEADKILASFEKAKDDTERIQIDMEARRLYVIYRKTTN